MPASRQSSCRRLALERLLDGLEVAVEPIVGRGATPTVRSSGDTLVILLADGAVLSFTPSQVSVVPRAPRRLGLERRPDAAEGISASLRIDVRYDGCVSVLSQLGEPLEAPLTEPDALRQTLDELLGELGARRPGAHAMVAALLLRCLILLLRRCAERGRLPSAWLAAAEDARLGRALAAMRAHPEHAFSLPELAGVAGMSRSAFAARFAEAIGRSPIDFLTDLRLARAAHILLCTDLPVKTVAQRVGYSSRSSFTRAFFGRHGVGPAAFRFEASASPDGVPAARAA